MQILPPAVHGLGDDLACGPRAGVVMAAPPGMGRRGRWGNAAGHDQAHAATGALGVEGGHALETVGASSRPTCMDPISTRFFSVVVPRSRAQAGRGNGVAITVEQFLQERMDWRNGATMQPAHKKVYGRSIFMQLVA